MNRMNSKRAGLGAVWAGVSLATSMMLAAGAHAQLAPNAAAAAIAVATIGATPASWRWQRLPDVTAADGSGISLRRAACAAATYCAASSSNQGDLVVRIEARAPAVAGQTLQVKSYRQGAGTPFMSHLRSVSSDGTIRDEISSLKYAPGRYAVVYGTPGGQGILAAVHFELTAADRSVSNATVELLPSPKALRLASASTVLPMPCVEPGTGGVGPRCQLRN